MEKLLKFRNLVALVLIGIALSEPLWNLIPVIKPKPDVAILNIDKPSDRIIELTKPISDLITDPTDRAKMAIYCQEFSNRVKNYEAQLQQVNDVLSLSASEFFQGSIKDKYTGLDESIITLISSATGGDDNRQLTNEEKNEISERFMGLAWSLIQRK
jgi:hypothetical protein